MIQTNQKPNFINQYIDVAKEPELTEVHNFRQNNNLTNLNQ